MKKNIKKIVYLSLSAELIHNGIMNIIKQANKYGNLTVGLLTDKAIGEYKTIPLMDYEQRLNILKNIKNIKKIIPQEKWDASENLKKIKPDYVIHGDDWKVGIQKKIRQKIITVLKKWKGKLIEIPYTKNISTTLIHEKIKTELFSNNSRVSRLARLFKSKKLVKIIESHSALTGLIIENLKIIKNNANHEFDGMWSSSLTDSTLKGKPDNQSVDYSSRILNLNEIMNVTTKPVIFDADNGGRLEHISYLVNSLERSGVSAIIIEDKIGLKKNSLFKNQSGAKQDSIKDFSKKINKATQARKSNDFLIIARIESFILEKGLNDALKRAEAYSRAGADAILIHSKKENPKEIFSFSRKFIKNKYFKPLVAVPSTYSKTKEIELEKNNFKMIIYANQLLRSSYPAMVDTAKSILINKRSFETEKKISSVNEILNLIK